MQARSLLVFLLFLPVLGCASNGVRSQAISPTGEHLEGSLSLQTMDGRTLDLDRSLAAGHSVALIFWQTWCSSCKTEMPELNEAAHELEGQVDFVGVIPGPDDRVDDGEVLAVAGSYALVYPQVRDRDLSLTRRFGVQGTPTIVVIGPDRSILFDGHRSPDWKTLTPVSHGDETTHADGADCQDGVCTIQR
ncbi:MAG: TlpA disulfide reductase family protein [Planctomycetota bacterium]